MKHKTKIADILVRTLIFSDDNICDVLRPLKDELLAKIEKERKAKEEYEANKIAIKEARRAEGEAKRKAEEEKRRAEEEKRKAEEARINSIVEAMKPSIEKMVDALELALIASAENISGFDANSSVLIACDTSGSMMWWNTKSKIKLYHVGLVLAMLLNYRCKNAITGIFGDEWMEVSLPKKSILRNIAKLDELEGRVGYSTNGYKVLDWLFEEKREVEKVMMFTDCQMWNSCNDGENLAKSWHRYKQFNPSAKLYLFDLSGYGSTPISIAERDVYLLSGWSDKVFDVLTAIENGKTALAKINEIAI